MISLPVPFSSAGVPDVRQRVHLGADADDELARTDRGREGSRQVRDVALDAEAGPILECPDQQGRGCVLLEGKLRVRVDAVRQVERDCKAALEPVPHAVVDVVHRHTSFRSRRMLPPMTAWISLSL
jgi:hypothetical protein